MASVASDDRAVRSYVAAIVGCSVEAVGAVTQFDLGNRHKVYKASCIGQPDDAVELVVRVSLTDDPQERLQIEREAAVLRAVDGVGAPRLVEFRLASPWFATPVLTTQFIPGHTFNASTASLTELERLGSLVAGVHAVDTMGVTEVLGSDGTIRAYAESRLRHILCGLPWVRDPLPEMLRDQVRRAAELIEQSWNTRQHSVSFDTDEPLALLHGDIALGNVIWSEGPILIDWEFARIGDPSDELAYVFDQSDLTSAQREAFWRGYRPQLQGPASIADVIDRARWWEPLTLLGSTLWWIERWIRRLDADAAGTPDPAVPKEPDYYIERIRSRADRLETLIDAL